MTGELILIVDDETSIIELADIYLKREGYKTRAVHDGAQALIEAREFYPDLIVLDLMLPEVDGFEVCRILRAENHPAAILMLTARDDEIDKILGLELGADDYLTKPFNPRELVARVKAILRRTNQKNSQTGDEIVKVGDLIIDPGKREVTCAGETIDLRTQEFEVLLVLARHKSIVLSRERLLSLAWGYDFYGQTRTVDVHIAQLRRKLQKCSTHIETVTGIGYKLVA
jgi:two-component system alkaline phosphatase synthesis response regulator PhoP